LNVKNRPIALDSDANDKDNSNSKNSNFINNVNVYENSKDANSNAKYPKTDDEAKDYILTAIKQRI
jgi:hypothetical protein